MEDGTRQTLYWADDAEAPASRPGFLKRLGQGAIVIGVGVLGFALLFGMRAEPGEVEPPRVIPTVTTVPARVTQGAIKVRGGGTVRPSAEVTIAPQVGGRVIWASPALVSGGRFLEGEPLLRVDPADYENAVEAADADVAQREVALLEAEENARLALDEWARLAARENLDPTPPNALVTRQPQLDAARAALRSAAARLDDTRLALQRTWIRAPFNGIVREETVDLGQFVAAGQSIGRLYATDEVEIVVPLSDNEAALIERLWSARAGEAETRIPVGITSEYGGVEYAWSGYVDRAEAALDEQTRTVDVVVRVPEPFTPTEDEPRRPPLLIGSYATVDIEGTSFEEYAIVPAGAVRDGDVLVDGAGRHAARHDAGRTDPGGGRRGDGARIDRRWDPGHRVDARLRHRWHDGAAGAVPRERAELGRGTRGRHRTRRHR